MVLLGRTAEQETLTRLLMSARLGHGGLLVLSGEPGVGKTALLEHVLSTADGSAPAPMLTATSAETERDLPFAALHALLLPALPLLAQIPEPQSESLAAALGLRPGRGQDRFAIGAATLSLLSRYAEDGAVTVVLDDVHWMDLPSAEAIAFAARRLGDDPVAVLVAGRASQVPPPFRDAPLLELDGLPLQESSALVSTHYPGRWTPGLLQALHRATGGNPLALVEFGRDPAAITSATDELPHTLPSRLRVAFGRRLEALSPPERNVALVAAVVGEDLRLIRAVCDALSLDAGGLSSAAEAGLVTVSDNRVRFTHPLLRSVTCGSAPQALRASAHRAVADLIDPADADRRVWHRAAAADRLDEQVAGELVDLSARATARSAFSIAATALERAARLSPASADARLRLVAAASSAWAAGHGDQALRLLAEAEPAHTVPSAAGAELTRFHRSMQHRVVGATVAAH